MTDDGTASQQQLQAGINQARGLAGPQATNPSLAKLSAPFAETFKDTRGGVELEYITGEQVISRLNDVLGFDWTFTVKEHGVHVEADECWVLGQLVVSTPVDLTTTTDVEQTRQTRARFQVVTREQFGSQKIRRARSNGTPVDIGFDLKGATTDALKKCAMSLGVGLYLSKKDAPSQAAGPAPSQNLGHAEQVPTCAECGVELKETRFRDGTVWGPEQLAGYGRRKHDRVLCMEHYRLANEARRRAERALEDVPA